MEKSDPGKLALQRTQHRVYTRSNAVIVCLFGALLALVGVIYLCGVGNISTELVPSTELTYDTFTASSKRTLLIEKALYLGKIGHTDTGGKPDYAVYAILVPLEDGYCMTALKVDASNTVLTGQLDSWTETVTLGQAAMDLYAVATPLASDYSELFDAFQEKFVGEGVPVKKLWLSVYGQTREQFESAAGKRNAENLAAGLGLVVLGAAVIAVYFVLRKRFKAKTEDIATSARDA